MITTSNRRDFLRSSFAAGVALSAPTQPSFAAAAKLEQIPPRLGFSLYGMKGLPLDKAIRACAEIGYDDVELALLPGYPTDPTQFGPAARKQLRGLLESVGLQVSCLMENLAVVTTDAEHRKNLDRMARAAELAHDLDCPCLMETVLGGKPADWPGVRGLMTDRLRDWAETAKKHQLIVAIKPHVGGAVHLPESARQLLDDVGSDQLRAVYDYSHYQVQGLKLDATLEVLADRTVFVHVKDGRRVEGKVQFLLPGDGDVNYTELFDLLRKRGYRGSVTIEVSNQLSSRPDYDPRAAARRSFQHLQPLLNPAVSQPLKRR